jgi:hypothetical protein
LEVTAESGVSVTTGVVPEGPVVEGTTAEAAGAVTAGVVTAWVTAEVEGTGVFTAGVALPQHPAKIEAQTKTVATRINNPFPFPKNVCLLILYSSFFRPTAEITGKSPLNAIAQYRRRIPFVLLSVALPFP